MALISQACALAFHAMVYLPEPGGAGVTLDEVATAFAVSRTHLAKVMQDLARHRLVTSRRGPHGGFVLRRAADTIRMIEVYEAVSGRFRPETCLLDRPRCGGGGNCCLDAVTQEMNRILTRFLTETRLSDARRKFQQGVVA